MTSRNSIPAAVSHLINAGIAAPSADNGQPWRFNWDGEFIRIYQRDTSGFGPDEHATLVSVGAVLENMAQAAQAMGGATVESWGNQRGVHAVVRPDIPDLSSTLSESGSDQHALFKRHTNRLATKREVIPSDIIRRLEAIEENGVSVVVFTKPADIRLTANAMEQAAAIRFRVPEIHRILADSLRFTPKEVACGDGLDVATLGLPPGSSWFLRWIRPWERMNRLNRFGLYRLMARLDSRRIASAPAVAVIVGGKNAEDAINGGKTLERAWILACQAGLAVHPYYAVTDQIERLRRNQLPKAVQGEAEELKTLVDGLPRIAGGQVHMVLRLAWPRRETPRSRRLPQSTLIV